MQNTLIFLVGFMGCGKSTFGRKLAKTLEYSFIDMDTYIEEKAGKTIPQIFTQNGELHFRQLETEAITALSKQANCIIATGGGAPCFNANMDKMNAVGKTVYLELSPQKLAERLSLDATERPVLEGRSGDELVGFIASKLKEREVFYQQAHYIVDADKPEDLIAQL